MPNPSASLKEERCEGYKNTGNRSSDGKKSFWEHLINPMGGSSQLVVF